MGNVLIMPYLNVSSLQKCILKYFKSFAVISKCLVSNEILKRKKHIDVYIEQNSLTIMLSSSRLNIKSRLLSVITLFGGFM